MPPTSILPTRTRHWSRVLLACVTIATLSAAASAGRSSYRNSRRGGGFTANVTVEQYKDALQNVQAANLSESLELLSKLELKRYEFKYDSVVGRTTQLGILGPELRTVAPQAVQVLPERFVFDRDGRGKVALQDFHIVDKDALYMHNLGATQQLIRNSRAQQEEILQLRHLTVVQQQKIDELQGYLEQEASAQLVQKRLIAEAEVANTEKLIEEARVRGKEERKTLDLKRDHELQVQNEKHVLEQKRMLEEDAARRDQNRDLVQLQEESNIRIERARRETEEVLKEKQLAADHARALLERNTTLEKAAIDVEGRIRQQRANQDIEMAQLQQRLEADRVKLMQALQSTFDNLGQGISVLLADKQKLTKFVGGFVALAAGIYLSREAIRIVGKLIEQRLGKPSLGQDELADVVLRSTLETRVFEIARSTRNAMLHGAPYRHLLLYGPPGTGKTMVARRLARASGMDYAILSGGDVGPLGSDAVTELHALFKWANSSPRGVLIFVDEAEAFLGCRATRKTHMSEAMRNALNALLYHTGTQSKKFMLVVATNRPEDLDTAVTDRIDDTLHFDLPETRERVRLLQMYFNEYVASLAAPPTATKSSSLTGKPDKAAVSVLPPVVDASVMAQYGDMTTGMSGREIAKMMLYMQSIVYAQDEVVVTPKLVDRVVKEKVDEHKRKLELKNYSEK
ncbi:atpase family aaa domain-containing protein 3-b-like [Phytophthora cinnamomi]|uniref:atpase family aaa domain-containing protein 3-b-like n=1 Tax=Phytophthora cinnamomi TaxID=4785 RepID=UPI003559F36E|nr:atpase family aaa domain-containing protein 3-b-like [Phytophthora cinnamomi]